MYLRFHLASAPIIAFLEKASVFTKKEGSNLDVLGLSQRSTWG